MNSGPPPPYQPAQQPQQGELMTLGSQLAATSCSLGFSKVLLLFFYIAIYHRFRLIQLVIVLYVANQLKLASYHFLKNIFSQLPTYLVHITLQSNRDTFKYRYTVPNKVWYVGQMVFKLLQYSIPSCGWWTLFLFGGGADLDQT